MEDTVANGREAPVLLFDGSCGFCSRLVRVVLRADRKASLHFASLEGDFARGVLARHRELEGVDSMAWVEPPDRGVPERVLIRSEAVMHLAHYLGFPWQLLTLARFVPAQLRDRLYDWLAKHRRRWFKDAATCSLPLAEHGDRFF